MNEGVFAKSMSEPIEDDGKLNEAGKGFGRFVVAGGDAAVGFMPAEEVSTPCRWR